TLAIYAGLHLFVCLPIHRLMVPTHSRAIRNDDSAASQQSSAAFSDPRLRWLMVSFALATFVFGVIAVHMIGVLTSAGLTAAPAELFGRHGLGALLGYLSRAGLYAKAIAPAAYSGMLAYGLTRNAALATLTVVALAAMGSYLVAVRSPKGASS